MITKIGEYFMQKVKGVAKKVAPYAAGYAIVGGVPSLIAYNMYNKAKGREERFINKVKQSVMDEIGQN